MGKLSIIIINWNSFELVKDCITSIYKAKAHVDFEIIIVDNASENQDIKEISKLFPSIKLICSEINEGFGLANNKAVEFATGDVLLLLNPDTVIKDNLIDLLYGKVKSSSTLGIVGPRIIEKDGSLQKDAARKFPTIFSMFANIFLLKKVISSNFFSEYISNYGKEGNVDFISGACVAVRKEVFSAVGGFSSEYFMYAEDVDLNFKVKKAGYDNYYLPACELIHYGGGASKKTHNAKIFEAWFFKSRRIFFKKKNYFEYCLLNLIYISGGLFRIVIATICVLGLSICVCKNGVEKYKAILNKYWLVFLLGLNIDLIKK